MEQYADVVNQIGGRAVDLDLTYNRAKQVPVRLDGADAPKLRIGVDPHDCVAVKGATTRTGPRRRQ